mmetsp:Transcript_50810/g.135573  ORF Transcript_50810/g.135573 Transcript_50810/m.135573 type:complete len:378 (+) Transcript_50810:1617-2750(+)
MAMVGEDHRQQCEQEVPHEVERREVVALHRKTLEDKAVATHDHRALPRCNPHGILKCNIDQQRKQEHAIHDQPQHAHDGQEHKCCVAIAQHAWIRTHRTGFIRAVQALEWFQRYDRECHKEHHIQQTQRIDTTVHCHLQLQEPFHAEEQATEYQREERKNHHLTKKQRDHVGIRHCTTNVQHLEPKADHSDDFRKTQHGFDPLDLEVTENTHGLNSNDHLTQADSHSDSVHIGFRDIHKGVQAERHEGRTAQSHSKQHGQPGRAITPLARPRIRTRHGSSDTTGTTHTLAIQGAFTCGNIPRALVHIPATKNGILASVIIRCVSPVAGSQEGRTVAFGARQSHGAVEARGAGNVHVRLLLTEAGHHIETSRFQSRGS